MDIATSSVVRRPLSVVSRPGARITYGCSESRTTDHGPRTILLMSSNGHTKTFVVDTNVLLHNPNAIFLFADNEVVIPFDVIEELDKFRTNNDDLGRNARSVIRHLDRLREQGNLSDGIDIKETGGRVRIVLEEDQKLCPGLTANTPDNRIICCAKMLADEGKRVVFVSKDI